MDNVIKTAAGLGILFLNVAIGAFIFSIMWGWFVVPLGLPTLSIAHAIGILSMLIFLTTKVDDADDDLETLAEVIEDGKRNLLFTSVTGAMFLGIGFVARMLM